MKKLYEDTRILDEKVRSEYALSEDIMMENAAAALETAVRSALDKYSHRPCLARPAVLILAGSGNNGADGYALARRLAGHAVSVAVCEVLPCKSQMALVQHERAAKLGVTFLSFMDLDEYIEEKSVDLRVAVDCIFGSGFHGSLPGEALAVIERVNGLDDVVRIACDVPSGLDALGNCEGYERVFHADSTVTMGALKLSLFSDVALDACGTVSVASLGVDRGNFESLPCGAYLLEETYCRKPSRDRRNVHKGSFGHVVVASGEKCGASVIAAAASLRFGAGLVSLHRPDGTAPGFDIPCDLMVCSTLPPSMTVLAAGMGLGKGNCAFYEDLLLSDAEQKPLPCVLDADMMYSPRLEQIVSKRSAAYMSLAGCKGEAFAESFAPMVLTPHPKEFCAVAASCLDKAELTPGEVVKNRLALVAEFCKRYPGVVMLLKGAATVIGFCSDGENVSIYINALGSPALAKAGSGDVLSGLVAALLAQGRNGLDAAATASISHAAASRRIEPSYSLTPSRLLDVL